jgi:hypothetical protein
VRQSAASWFRWEVPHQVRYLTRALEICETRRKAILQGRVLPELGAGFKDENLDKSGEYLAKAQEVFTHHIKSRANETVEYGEIANEERSGITVLREDYESTVDWLGKAIAVYEKHVKPTGSIQRKYLACKNNCVDE